MAVNRYRIRHLAEKGNRGAKQVLSLLNKTDKLLGTILLGNNVVNAALTALVTALAIKSFGNDDQVIALATTVAALLLIIFAELIPKISGANKPDGVAMFASYILIVFVWILRPLVFTINQIVSGMLSLANLKLRSSKDEGLTTQELRSAVLESAGFIPLHNRKILLNILDLEELTVDDVMVPHGKIEYLNIEDEIEILIEQISTSFHNRLLVCQGDLNKPLGILHVKRAIGSILKSEFNATKMKDLIQPIHFIPLGAKLFTELKSFQNRSENMSVIVDEYGEVQGIVTPQDIIEELVGEFKTDDPNSISQKMIWDTSGEIIVDGLTPLRELNKELGINFPLDGPRTLNGLLLETLEDLPQTNLSLKINEVTAEILTVQGRLIKRIRLKKIENKEAKP
jgi:Mg2+/Co2+ transporter CorB